MSYIHSVLKEYLDDFLVVYLDDILIYSNNQEEHDTHVRLVLDKLRQHSLFGKLDKCAFDLQEVPFLGYIVSSSNPWSTQRMPLKNPLNPLPMSMEAVKIHRVLLLASKELNGRSWIIKLSKPRVLRNL